jgi:hypothetical protein
LKLAHGEACVHGFESDPDGDKKTFADDGAAGAGQALVAAVSSAFADRFPAAS